MLHWVFMSLAGIMGYVIGMRKSPLLHRPFNSTKLVVVTGTMVIIVLVNFVVWHIMQLV